MKKATSIIAALFLAAVFTTTFESCGKYEEGPSFTIKTKKGRISRDWIGEEIIDHHTGASTALSADDGTFSFDKDGTLTMSLGNVSVTGEWKFSDDKADLLTGFDDGTGTIDWDTTTIHRLTSKELWTVAEHGDEYHYKAK